MRTIGNLIGWGSPIDAVSVDYLPLGPSVSLAIIMLRSVMQDGFLLVPAEIPFTQVSSGAIISLQISLFST